MKTGLMQSWRTIALLLLLAPLPIFWLSYSGFCFRKMRFLSDTELLTEFKLDYLARSAAWSFPEGEARKRLRKIEEVGRKNPAAAAPEVGIAFQNLEDFDASNPDCCSLYYSYSTSGLEATLNLAQKMFGCRRSYVHASINARFISDSAGPVQVKTSMPAGITVVENCGSVRHDY